MHFVTGGSFNGKKSWVKEFYHNREFYWLSSYNGGLPPGELSVIKAGVLVFEGIEGWIKELTHQYNAEECRKRWEEQLVACRKWEESSPNREVVFIGVDITKGIVPIDKKERIWRDVTGWCYQDLAKSADRVDLVWYGINQRIK